MDQQAAKPELNKELLADLTVGLPGYFRLLHESFALFRLQFLMFISVTILPFTLVLLTKTFTLTVQHHVPSMFTIFVSTISIAIQIIFFSLGYLALLFAIKDNEEKISIIEVYKRAMKHMKGYWRILLLSGIVIVVGTVGFIVPGIIFSIWLSMAILIYLVEDLWGMDALLQSKNYVQKYWVAVFGRFVFIGIVGALFYLPLLLVGLLHQTMVYELVFLLITFIVLPIVSTFWFLLYGNLRVLKGDTSAFVTVLKETHATKEKLSLFRPALLKGAILGLPLVLLFVYMFVTRPFVVQGDSMSPAYVNNEYLMSAYSSAELHRGDVIIFRSPIDPTNNLIKRVIGLPGETIMVQSGDVLVNSVRIDESSYRSSDIKIPSGLFLQESYMFHVPRGQYIVLGDNRANSEDSREWGPIRRSDVIGKVSLCFWNCPKNVKEVMKNE